MQFPQLTHDRGMARVMSRVLVFPGGADGAAVEDAADEVFDRRAGAAKVVSRESAVVSGVVSRARAGR